MPAPLPSTLNLGLQIVVLVIFLAAIPFAKRGTSEGFKTHGRLMTTAIVLNLVGVILVMIPSLLAYLTAGGVISSLFLLIEIPHSLFGFLALALGIAFVLNKKPKNLKTWMRLTATFWILAFLFGFLNYLWVSGFL
jgi:uncharacterized membrane protein YozB (DUF420 family)